jgi:hypothetical protein
VSYQWNSISGSSDSTIQDLGCPTGYYVAGGGPNSGATSFTLQEDAPESTFTWRGQIYNESSTIIAVGMSVVCLGGTLLYGQVVSGSLGTVNPGSHSSYVDVGCPTGMLAAGGGPASGYAPFALISNDPNSTTKWEGEVQNTGGSSILLQMNVICLVHLIA